MPIYEYLCNECGHELEALQKISDDALVYCPECGAKSLKKKISAAAFRLKGGGWYETDFKDKNKRNVADSTEPGNPSGGDAKKESKPKSAPKDSGDAKPARSKTASAAGA